MSNKEKDLVFIICPPLSDYPEAPAHMSHCELFDCPECKEKMWLSEKKKAALSFSQILNKDIKLFCYSCAKKFFEENKDIFKKSKLVRL